MALLLAATAIYLKWSGARRFSDPRTLLSRFPVEDAIVLNIDFSAIRLAGLLPDSKAPLEPEYKQFLDGSGFDYRHDLDSVTATISNSGNFFIARGRFNWPKLQDYASKQGGSCYQDLCRMPGSRPERRISFLPLRDDVIALAVSTDDLAANRLTKPGDPLTAELPNAPAWLIVPGSALHDPNAFPPGLRLMLSALTNADRLVLTAGLSGTTMEATCRTKEDAHILASQLRVAMATLKEADQDQLAKALSSGTFEDTGTTKVTGQWPFSKALLADLTSGL